MIWQDWCAVVLFVVFFELCHRHGVAATLRLIWRFFAETGQLDRAERRAHADWRLYGRRSGRRR